MEEWKEVEGFSRYKVSNNGEVFDTKTNKLVAKQLTGIPQYYYANMNRDDGKRKLVRIHILVAKAFLPNTDNLEMVDHRDKDKLNNAASNLRWVSRATNARNKINDFFVEYNGEQHLLVDLVFSQFGVNRKMYQYMHTRIVAYKEDYDKAVESWFNRRILNTHRKRKSKQ